MNPIITKYCIKHLFIIKVYYSVKLKYLTKLIHNPYTTFHILNKLNMYIIISYVLYY